MGKNMEDNSIVYIVNYYGEPEEITWREFVYIAGADETTTPRGVAPRLFVEGVNVVEDLDYWIEDLNCYMNFNEIMKEFKEVEENAFYDENSDVWYLRLFVISSWGVGGNNYEKGKYYYSSKQAAEAALFEIWERKAIDNDQYIFYADLDELLESYVEVHNTSIEVLKFLFENDIFEEELYKYDLEILKVFKKNNLLDVDLIQEYFNPKLSIKVVKSIIDKYNKLEKRFQEIREEKKKRELNYYFNGLDKDSILSEFFKNEIHPAPQIVVQLKNKSGLSWAQLRDKFKR